MALVEQAYEEDSFHTRGLLEEVKKHAFFVLMGIYSLEFRAKKMKIDGDYVIEIHRKGGGWEKIVELRLMAEEMRRKDYQDEP